MNLGTGTVALPGGVADGLTYDVRSAVAPEVTEEQLRDATDHPVDRSEELELLPPPVRNLAADLVEGRDAGWDQMAAIRDAFVNGGFYDATPDTPPGHSYGRIATMLEDPARVVGFEEQYAAAAAVMAQVAGLPVRVVVGYELPADAWRNGAAEVTANDISAWVELDAGELGWVPVDVTPDRSRAPDPEAQGATTQEIAIPNPPPPPPPPPNVEPPRQRGARSTSEEMEPIGSRSATAAAWRRGRPSPSASSACRSACCCFRARRRRLEGAAAAPPAHPTVTDGADRRRVGRGDRPLHGGRRAAVTAVTPHERVGVYVGDAAPRRRSSPTCGGSPARSTGRRTRPRRPATGTPPTRGAAATRSPPSCARAASAGGCGCTSTPAPAPRPRHAAAPGRRGRPMTDDAPARTGPDDDDDVTVPGDHELLAELRRRAARGARRPTRTHRRTTTSRSTPTTT